MLSVVQSSTLLGVDALPVSVECSISDGQLPLFTIVGLPTVSVKEGAVRIRSALASVGHELPSARVTVNLAPADLRKPGSALDLPTALSILFAEQLYEPALIDNMLVLGELGLDGSVRRVPGVLASTILAKRRGMRGVIVPEACVREALVVEGVEVCGIHHLRDLLCALAGERDLIRTTESLDRAPRLRPPHTVDMAEVRGQDTAREAITIAVAGGHNLLLAGPPGTGKTMLARRIPTVLPEMTREEALETTKIYSALGLANGLVEDRPFRAPHHTISSAALLGGGTQPRPGEISLAHNGVLFLDELPEFARGAIEALRQPLEERSVTIARVHGTLRLPASFMLVAAANPCPCGWYGSGGRECTCSQVAIERYQARLSGPLLDRIDLQVMAAPVTLEILRSESPGESSATIRDRVVAARERQLARLAPHGLRCNAEMTSRVLRKTCRLDAACETELARVVVHRGKVSARSVDRIIKVARTLADLANQAEIRPEDISVASGFRTYDPLAAALAVLNPPPPRRRRELPASHADARSADDPPAEDPRPDAQQPEDLRTDARTADGAPVDGLLPDASPADGLLPDASRADDPRTDARLADVVHVLPSAIASSPEPSPLAS